MISGGGSGSVLQHPENSNMEEHLARACVETEKINKSFLDPSPETGGVLGASDSGVTQDWQEERHDDDDVSTSGDDIGHDNKTTADNKLNDSHTGGSGMRTRGNRRPIQLTERMRQKRHTLQDMAKPLKAWLYEHRDNPYPTKNEKLVLAGGSQMTLVQVSNWFANARRRLKNTVRQPGLSWSKRIKLYNSHVTGNAERLSMCSSMSSISQDALEDEQVPAEDNSLPQLYCYETTSNYSSRLPSTMSQDAHLLSESQPESPHDEGAQHKFKHTIMHRYLNDSCEYAQRYQEQQQRHHHHHFQSAEGTTRRWNGSGTGSVSSHDYEDVCLSRLSPQNDRPSDSRPDGSVFFEDLANGDLAGTIRNRLESSGSSEEDQDTYWQEINAALALTNMARACRQLQPIVACFR